MSGQQAAAAETRGLGWHPLARRRPVLTGIDLTVAAGERVLLAGPSGSGKSTLLRAVAGVLAEGGSGTLTGTVTRGGVPVLVGRGEFPPPVGLLLQEPADALVASRVGRDVAFGPENLGLPRAEITRRVSTALSEVGFGYPAEHRTASLSGGERQRLALAGALAMDPPLLLLDEPLAMLDPAAAAEVREAVLASVAGRSSALIVVDHQLDRWVDVVDRLVVLDADGRIRADGPPGSVLDRDCDRLAAAGLWVPGLAAPQPRRIDPRLVAPRTRVGPPGRAALAAERVRLRRSGSPVEALHEVSVAVPAGRVTAVTGRSGAGKSTLAAVLAGLIAPDSGTVGVDPDLAAGLSRPVHRWRSAQVAARIGWVPQNPERGFVTRQVAAELTATPAALGQLDGVRMDERAAGLLAALGLSGYAGADPYQLSGGEQRRLALAASLAHGPGVLILDEPTVGQDRHTWAAVAGVAAAARDAGVAVLVATHDRVFVDQVADSQTRLVDGCISPRTS